MFEHWLEKQPTQAELEKQAKEEEDKRKREMFRVAIAYREVFISPFGKTVLEDLKRSCLYLPSSAPLAAASQADGHIDIPQTMMNIGVHSVMKYIEHQIKLAEENINSSNPI
jgi:hypothetical protein